MGTAQCVISNQSVTLRVPLKLALPGRLQVVLTYDQQEGILLEQQLSIKLQECSSLDGSGF